MIKSNGNIKIICGFLAGIIVGSATIVGANQAIQAIQNTEIKVSLNGEVQEFKDETTGETQYPITYHDRTYLPLRNVAQLSGLKVDYDNSQNEAMLIGSSCIKRIKLGDNYITLIFGGEGGVYGREVEVYLEFGDVASPIGTFYENGEDRWLFNIQ